MKAAGRLSSGVLPLILFFDYYFTYIHYHTAAACLGVPKEGGG